MEVRVDTFSRTHGSRYIYIYLVPGTTSGTRQVLHVLVEYLVLIMDNTNTKGNSIVDGFETKHVTG